ASLIFAQCWTLDETGNWQNFREDTNGAGIWSLIQDRTSNQVNEITLLTEPAGPGWVTPVYDGAGNMTTTPQPASPTQSFTGTYDAWNRLVQLTEGSVTVAKYAYDGLNRRTIKYQYSGGVLSERRHMLYSQHWQVVEERVEATADAERQFVWGLR